MSGEQKRIQATVHGRVQGVGFRYFVLENAKRLNLTGWTRNRFNRTVEVVAEGEDEKLRQLLHVLGSGPRASNVINVDYYWQSATREFEKFKIRMTR
ncbi:MAG: acylphosphatase [Chloroflexi bacterium]|nr:acylphosphatase [Chloroflexota bacterium]